MNGPTRTINGGLGRHARRQVKNEAREEVPKEGNRGQVNIARNRENGRLSVNTYNHIFTIPVTKSSNIEKPGTRKEVEDEKQTRKAGANR